MSAATSPLNKSAEPITWNFKLLAQNDLGGFGGMGEGMAVQIAKDGRRIIWLAHESAPKNFTGVDQPYETPEHPELHLKAGEREAATLADEVIEELTRREVLWNYAPF